MSQPRILDPQASYTFSKYFELNFDAEDVFAELGCTYERLPLSLPQATKPLSFGSAPATSVSLTTDQFDE